MSHHVASFARFVRPAVRSHLGSISLVIAGRWDGRIAVMAMALCLPGAQGLAATVTVNGPNGADGADGAPGDPGGNGGPAGPVAPTTATADSAVTLDFENQPLTDVVKAFYRNEFTSDGTRVAIDSAPHFVANAGFILNDFRGFNSSLTLRNISHYRLDGENPALQASGNDIVDFAVSKRLKKWVDLNFAIDNLLNKKYYETQNFFDSRACPTCDVTSRIHATPGYPFTVSIGLTFRIKAKQ